MGGSDFAFAVDVALDVVDLLETEVLADDSLNDEEVFLSYGCVEEDLQARDARGCGGGRFRAGWGSVGNLIVPDVVLVSVDFAFRLFVGVGSRECRVRARFVAAW